MNTGTSRINIENKIKKRVVRTVGDSMLGRFQQGSNVIKVVQAGALPVDTGLGSVYHGKNK